MSLFILLFALIGAGIGYLFATNERSNSLSPLRGALLGGAGGLIGGILVRSLFPVLLGLIGAAIGAMALLWAFKTYGRR